MHFPFFRSSFSGFSIFFPICSLFNLYFCLKLKRQNMKINVHSMLLLSLAALLSSCAAEGNDKKQDLIVKTTQAVPVSHQGDKEFSFIARPFRTSELSFRVGGRPNKVAMARSFSLICCSFASSISSNLRRRDRNRSTESRVTSFFHQFIG